MTSSRSRPRSLRQTWLTIFGALCVSSLSYAALGYCIAQSPKPRAVNPAMLVTLTPILVALTLVALLGSVAWMKFRVDGRVGTESRGISLSPRKFQSDSIIALALSEMSSVFGLLLFLQGASLKELTLFVLGTLFVNFIFILPRGLQFWNALEQRSEPKNSPFSSLNTR